ncbi:MAG: succinate dehydrogenase, hydrophobic membrane anchor protein [Xanthomonadales bacterium]|nr:succinate dehydrogenase, hydrophobic membrane anchor protein [Xanthomonadales bacterium]
MSGEGLGHWRWQRISSVVLIPLTGWLLWAVTQVAGADYQAASQFFGAGVNAALAILTTAVIAYHAQSGIQVICEDYIPPPWQGLLVWLTRLACLAGLLALAWAVLGIAGRAGA